VSETTDAIRELLVEDGASVGDDTPLLGDVLDSLAIVKLVSLLEDRFGIEVRSEDLTPDNFATIASIARYVESRR
jgi:acyl carrier protein